LKQKIIEADDPAGEFLRLYERYWWFSSFNTDYAEDLYWSFWDNNYQMGQIYYDALM
jgi:hypothetical protein